MMRRLVLLSLTAVAFAATGRNLMAQAIYADLPRPVTRPPTIRPPAPDSRLVLEKHQVRAEVTDSLATYRIDQTFRNPTDRTIEGVYLFPIPKGAISRGIHLTINGVEVAGEVLSAEQARGVYQEIVRKMRDPALLEFVEQGLLRASIFPIAPRAEVKVALEFAAQAEQSLDVQALSLPLRFAADSGASLLVDVKITTSKPLTTIYSPSHAVDVARTGDRQARVSFEGKADKRGDFRLYYASERGDLGMSLLCQRQPAQDGHFVLVLSPKHEVAPEDASPRDLIFVLDRSGSMAGEKWEQAMAALEYGLGTLNPQDRFALISFATDVRAYKPSLVEANPEEIAGARAHLKQLRPAGGTNIASSLDQALSQFDEQDGRLRLVAFVTDGLPTIGEIEPEQILKGIANKRPDSRLFSFGIGFDVHTVLLDRLAEGHRGASSYITEGENLELCLSAFFTKVAEPVLVNPSLAVRGVELYDVYPPKLPDLFAGEALVVTGRYRGEGQHAITLSGQRGGVQHVFTTESTFAKIEAGNAALPSVWASRKIGYLLREIRLHGANQELVDAVMELGKEYGIVTPYTAGLVVEEGMTIARYSGVADSISRLRRDGPASPGSAPGFLSGESRKKLESLGWAGAEADAASESKNVGRAAVLASREIAALADGAFAGDEQLLARQAGVEVRRLQVGGRRLVDLGDAVIDLAYKPEMKGSMREVITYSDEYFKLLATDPDLSAVLALGENVLLVKDGMAIWVHPAAE